MIKKLDAIKIIEIAESGNTGDTSDYLKKWPIFAFWLFYFWKIDLYLVFFVVG